MNVKSAAVAVLSAVLFAIAWQNPGAMGKEAGGQGRQIDLNCDPAVSDACARARLREGRRLFDVGRFGGNGRTCRTCHSNRTGTFSPEEALARLVDDPGDALFVHDGLDDGVSGTTRITQHATVRIEIPLPAGVILANDPSRRSVILNRGTPTTLNTPALDPMLMYDTREPNLELQAFNAIQAHAQNTRHLRRWSWNSSGSSSRRIRASSRRRRCEPLPTAVLRRNSRPAEPSPNGAGARCSTTCLSMA